MPRTIAPPSPERRLRSGPDLGPRARASAGRIRWLLLTALGACSTMPDTEYPPSRLFEVHASYSFSEIEAGEAASLQLPTTNRKLVVYELQVTPTAGSRETYADRDARTLLLPPGTREARVRCRLRLYADSPAQPAPDADDVRRLFPGAEGIELAPPTTPRINP